MKKSTRLDRFSYLIRGWVASSSGRDPPIWRFSLEEPVTGERRGFASFEELISFLETLLAKRDSVDQED